MCKKFPRQKRGGKERELLKVTSCFPGVWLIRLGGNPVTDVDAPEGGLEMASLRCTSKRSCPGSI